VSTDTGRQPERTRLAWRRTVLATTVVTVLTARLAGFGVPVTVLAVLLWLAVLVVSQRRMAAVLRPGPPPAGPAAAVLACLIVGFALLGALALALRTE
jgi:hypothetical protein